MKGPKPSWHVFLNACYLINHMLFISTRWSKTICIIGTYFFQVVSRTFKSLHIRKFVQCHIGTPYPHFHSIFENQIKISKKILTNVINFMFSHHRTAYVPILTWTYRKRNIMAFLNKKSNQWGLQARFTISELVSIGNLLYRNRQISYVSYQKYQQYLIKIVGHIMHQVPQHPIRHLRHTDFVWYLKACFQFSSGDQS